MWSGSAGRFIPPTPGCSGMGSSGRTRGMASELQRRITEALKMDDRVRGISGFTYAVEGDMLRASLTVSTVYGEMQTSVEVTLN